MVDKASKQITLEFFRDRFRGFVPLGPFQNLITEEQIDTFFRIYESHLREEANFKEISPAKVERGISDSNKFMAKLEQKIEELRLWLSTFEAKKRPWADSLAESILEEFDKFHRTIRQEFNNERHMMQLRKSYIAMRPQKFSLHSFTAALDKFINREITVPQGTTREEFTNLLIAGVMVGTTDISPIEAKRFDEGTRGRIRQQIYYARQWDRNHPFDETDIGLKKWTSPPDEKTKFPRKVASGKGAGKIRPRGKNKQGA